jgi:hypothetical protein
MSVMYVRCSFAIAVPVAAMCGIGQCGGPGFRHPVTRYTQGAAGEAKLSFKRLAMSP